MLYGSASACLNFFLLTFALGSLVNVSDEDGRRVGVGIVIAIGPGEAFDFKVPDKACVVSFNKGIFCFACLVLSVTPLVCGSVNHRAQDRGEARRHFNRQDCPLLAGGQRGERFAFDWFSSLIVVSSCLSSDVSQSAPVVRAPEGCDAAGARSEAG